MTEKKSITVSIKVTQTTAEILDKMAKEKEWTRSYLAARIIEEYIKKERG